jgi:hypothetical protein
MQEALASIFSRVEVVEQGVRENVAVRCEVGLAATCTLAPEGERGAGMTSPHHRGDTTWQVINRLCTMAVECEIA